MEQIINAYIPYEDSEDKLENYTLVTYINVKVITKKIDIFKGAILFTYNHPDTPTICEEWIPKYLCRNVDEEEKTIYIKTSWLEKNKPWLLPEYAENN